MDPFREGPWCGPRRGPTAARRRGDVRRGRGPSVAVAVVHRDRQPPHHDLTCHLFDLVVAISVL